MKSQIRFYIDFYSEYEASIRVTSSILDTDISRGELLGFTSYVIDQLHNLEKEVAIKVANILFLFASTFDISWQYRQFIENHNTMEEIDLIFPLIAAFGVELEGIVGFIRVSEFSIQISDLAREKGIEAAIIEIIHNKWPQIAHLVPYRGEGEYKIICDILLDDEKALTHLDVKGSNGITKPVSWYIGISIILLFKFLLESRITNQEYCWQLKKIAEICGNKYLNSEVTSSNKNALPFDIVTLSYQLSTLTHIDENEPEVSLAIQYSNVPIQKQDDSESDKKIFSVNRTNENQDTDISRLWLAFGCMVFLIVIISFFLLNNISSNY